MDRVAFATSTGSVWLFLAMHFTAGLASIVAGAIAIAVAKGSRLHRQSGMVFTWGMIFLGLSAAGIGAYERVPSQVFAGLIAVYLVVTGTTTVRPLLGIGRRTEGALMVLALAFAATSLYGGVNEWRDPLVKVVGRPRVGPPLIIGTIVLLAAIGDWRALRAGGLKGSRRLARHLWRMSFALFVATGSFFLGQMKIIPPPVRVVPVLLVLAFAPLPVLFYWMWRVRLRGRLGGMLITGPEDQGAR